jgi:hypothetical protein
MANSRADLTPSSSLPIAYFALSHLSLAAGLLVLVVQPALPGGFFYHPKMMALVHVVTLTWLTGSIFGAFYIVGPLVLRLPMPVRAADWTAFGAFLVGVLGMIPHFWMGEYVGMLWGAYLITGAVAWVAARAWRGLPAAPVPWPIKLHVGLAFANFLAAATLGILIGLDRTRGGFGFPPLAAAYAHAHLAAVGWVTLMVVGIAYRLIPMMLPAAMPEGGRLARSAIFLEAGLAVVVWALLAQSPWLPAGAVLITAGLGSFVVEIRRALRHRQPRPPTLPPRDWSTWQTHGALLWLIVAVGLGLVLSVGGGAASVPLMWLYGVAGLVGFLAQIVAGIQGRLVPLYAWYRAMARRGGAPPARSAHSLPSVPLARFTFLTWSGGVPLLAWGLAAQQPAVISLGAVLLLCGVAAGGAHLLHMLRGAVAGSRAD